MESGGECDLADLWPSDRLATSMGHSGELLRGVRQPVCARGLTLGASAATPAPWSCLLLLDRIADNSERPTDRVGGASAPRSLEIAHGHRRIRVPRERLHVVERGAAIDRE